MWPDLISEWFDPRTRNQERAMFRVKKWLAQGNRNSGRVFRNDQHQTDQYGEEEQ
jgi:hypothetical protein